MKKNVVIGSIRTLAIALPVLAVLSGCGSPKAPTEAEKPTVVTEAAADTSSVTASASPETLNDKPKDEEGIITDDQALSAIKSYCYASMPDLKSIEEEYPVGWEIESSDDNAIVVLFRSYTGALVRYYIDPVSGEAYVTEFVSGITPEEERTEETLNVKDYL